MTDRYVIHLVPVNVLFKNEWKKCETSRCVCVCEMEAIRGQRSSPGTTATSRSRAKSSSSVGGWCCRGQVDTAAVSCSSSRIHTWIRPGGGGATVSGDQPTLGGERGGGDELTCVVVKLLQDTLHAVLRAGRALLAAGRQAGESSAEKHRP